MENTSGWSCMNDILVKVLQIYIIFDKDASILYYRNLRISFQKGRGLVLPLQRTDEIHIPNPSWMQSPSYEEAWNEPHIWFRQNKMKVAFGGVDFVSQPPRQPDRSNEQTGTSNALAFPGSKSTQNGVTECSCCWSNFTSKGLLCAKRQKMLEDMEKDFEGGQEADKFDGGGGSKSSGSLDIRFRLEKVQAPLCDWKTATLEYSL
ncbi:unnamed protein product [Brassica oleracea]